MMSFGGLNNDPFLNSLMMGIADPFEDMFKFSDCKTILIQCIKMYTTEEHKDLMCLKAL